MRPRHLLPVSLLLMGALIAPGCSSDDKTDTASSSSNERNSGTDSGDSGNSGDPDPNPDGTPDLSDLTENIPGLENMGDCVTQAAAFGSLYMEALGGEDGAKTAQKKAEDLKAVLPDDLHDDIDVISEAIGTVAEEGIINGSDALESKEYQRASDAITKYFDQECGSGG